ncbi:hypothetical protein JDV02_007976 [Purpureocillium takamizusanense]|uniref:Ribosome biogenesis protein Urb1 n=1 Tax=Purpureocillium takamizusanense TaxID=2060973 RepID=A0A9Q8QNL2_9HYPO|nr:uncharacterized protein JDV02_007976 [Purpureocillium takamizusanense]UNI22051.1 hypothetical protein JDV02_007976 [Purpureocillium takamizusanense]
MGKRASNGGTDGAAAFRKRQKLAHEAPSSEDIESSDQLRRLLAFDQDLRRARHGLQSFKKLLDEAIAGDGDRKAKLAILQQYLETVKPKDAADNDDAVFLGDVMEMWSFAAQVNDDGVMSSVAVVLALLLQAVSEHLHLVSHGLGICRTLLQERQLKSLSRNLSAEKGKGFVISPTLRLLREAVCLDGGAYARRIVRERSYTFASLGRNLEIGHTGDGQEDLRRASVRTNALRFFLSCLKYLHPEGRRELLSQRELLSHLTYMIKGDPPYLVIEILDTLKAYVLAETKIPRDVKFKSFNTKSLLRFLALYNYSSPTNSPDDRDAVIEKAHQFLMYVCTTPVAGVLYPYKGLYPKESDEETASRSSKGQVGAATDSWEGRFQQGIPVFNFVLSEFAAKLRPWSSLKHSELLVAMFTAAPELIADYFYNNRSFTFEPKLSMTWIGYAAFLFSTMTLPLLPAFGDPLRYANLPPPTSVLLDNILPPAINEKVLVRCLSPKSHLTAFFATRILVAALEKLKAAVVMLQSSSSRSHSTLWSTAVRRLVDAFCQRIPDMKEVVRCYKSIPPENVLQRALASRSLRLYYEVIPRVALAANFDVSPLFVDILKSIHQDNHGAGTKALATMELENLVSIASYSPGMRWFTKVEGLGQGTSLSAFTALLRLLCDGDRDSPEDQLKETLSDVAIENQLVSKSAGLQPLLRALQCTAEDAKVKDMSCVWSLLDNCINRCATSPIKYLDQLQSYSADDTGSAEAHVSLLSVALVEQTPYATDAADHNTARTLGRFLSLYFSACHLWDGSGALSAVLHEKVGEHMTSKKVKLSAISNKADVERLQKAGTVSTPRAVAGHIVDSDSSTMKDVSLQEMLQAPLMEAGDAGALVKWASKSVEDFVEDGWAANLVRLLSSEHTSIRKEALVNILKMAAQIKESSYEEKTQMWLLLSEVAESSRAQLEVGPVPSAFVAFTVHSIDILRNPLHPLYPKVNSFLTRSPVWSLEKLPLAHDILHGEPSEDDKYYAELAWLLTYLLDSLRTPFDLGVFHKKKWFEKILALGSNPYLRSHLRTRILKIIYRVTCIEAGSTTLVTRFGVMSWLDAQRAACAVEDEAAVFRRLIQRVWETCDQQRVTAWSNGGIVKAFGALLAA